jgi:protein CWC15
VSRPTWAPAKGGEITGGARYFGASKQYSARDIASHQELKTRKDGQASVLDLADRDLLTELEERERVHYHKKR